MIKTSTLLTIQKDCMSAGFEIKVRDIAYILLCKQFSDDEVAYKCLFPNDDNFKEYDERSLLEIMDRTMRGESVYPGRSPDPKFGDTRPHSTAERYAGGS